VKILIVYHAGATANARHIFRDLAKLEDVQLTAVVAETIETDPLYSPDGWLHSGPEDWSNGYHYIPLPLRNPRECNEGFRTEPLRRVMGEVRPDVLHVLHEPTSGYLFQIAYERLRTCISARTLFYGFDNVPIRFRRIYSPLKWQSMWSLLAGGAAANTESLEHTRGAGFPEGKPLERIFWGIPTDIFRPIHGVHVRQELGLDCPQIAGFVGRLVPEKGPDIFLEALSLLPATIHGVVIGTGPMREELASLAQQISLSGRIHFVDATGHDALAKFLNCMDVLAVPSLTSAAWKEQFGRVIAEAMACGVPVVGSDSGAIPEVLSSAGLVVPERDPKALAESMRIAIYDAPKRAALRESGLRRAQTELSTQAMARNLVRFYTRVLEG
jgi:glycosyltransferase involved in cell wall biosynthesis